jgi:hypothetical protein
VCLASESKLPGDFLTYLIATNSDSRSNGGRNVSWRRPELGSHLLKSLKNNTSGGPTPPGMYGSNCSILSIGEQNRVAVGGADRDSEARTVRDEGVPFAEEARAIGQKYPI